MRGILALSITAPAIECTTAPWTMGSGASSGVVTVNVSFSARPSLAVERDGSVNGASATLLGAVPSVATADAPTR